MVDQLRSSAAGLDLFALVCFYHFGAPLGCLIDQRLTLLRLTTSVVTSGTFSGIKAIVKAIAKAMKPLHGV
jgi:hypothetical protein